MEGAQGGIVGETGDAEHAFGVRCEVMAVDLMGDDAHVHTEINLYARMNSEF